MSTERHTNGSWHFVETEPPGQWAVFGDTAIEGTRQLPNVAWVKHKKDAAFIVRAVNSFDSREALVKELVAAVDAAVKLLLAARWRGLRAMNVVAENVYPTRARVDLAQTPAPPPTALQQLIDAMTPEQQEAELRAQRESWARGEAGIGNDADEAQWRAAHSPEAKAEEETETP